MRLCAAYQRPLTREMVEAYHEALSDLLPREAALAFAEGTRRCKWFPNPAELREAMTVALERMPRRTESDPSCPKCQGAGWKEVEKNGLRFVASCDCRKREQTG
jgi:hypothetical protein